MAVEARKRHKNSKTHPKAGDGDGFSSGDAKHTRSSNSTTSKVVNSNRRNNSSTHRQNKQLNKTSKLTKSQIKAGDQELTLEKGITFVVIFVGVFVGIYLSYKHANLMNTQHENNMYFTNIKNVEREISFRTESGLYYSYYKNFLASPSLKAAFFDLIYDNKTEHLRTINILARFNVYQEVFLAIIYRTFTFIETFLEPIYFYIYAVFSIHGFLVFCLYTLTWLLTNTWVSGILAVLFYIFNQEDTTRVSYVIPLREHFSLPFLWMELAIVTFYLRPSTNKFKQKLCLVGILISGLLYTITWQFNQFVILLQAMSLFAVGILDFIPFYKAKALLLSHLVCLLSVSVMQFFNTMIIAGLAFSFIVSSLFTLSIHKLTPKGKNIFINIGRVLFFLLLQVLSMVFTHFILKLIFNPDADTHIYKFVLNKFQLGFSRDFDVMMYLCNGAFTFLDWEFIDRMSKFYTLQLYSFGHTVGILLVIVSALKMLRNSKDSGSNGVAKHLLSSRPEIAYHVVQAFLFGILGISTLRMKYLWSPYICIIASVILCDTDLWSLLSKFLPIKNKEREIGRHVVLIGVIVYVLMSALPPLLKSLEALGEFYDPDTVDLMEWINEKTPSTAAFTGSMQLLAGVKLCTGRPLTNHPHYEDRVLRERTYELMQIYARRSPEDIHEILLKYDTSYIILEDSICMIPSDGCRLPDLLDIQAGILPRVFNGNTTGLVKSDYPRFCDEVRYQRALYKKYFKPVFENRTFRVYKIIKS